MSFTYSFGGAIASMIIYGLARGFNDANLMPVCVKQPIGSNVRSTFF